jgi:protein gp37
MTISGLDLLPHAVRMTMKTSAIGWTDFSGGDLNFVTGCTPVSEGCQNCYAMAIYKRWGRDFDTVKVHEDKRDRLYPGKWPEWSPKRGEGHRPMAFVCDTGDLFHDAVPDEFIWYAFNTMLACHDMVEFQVLTKRPERMRIFVTDYLRRRNLPASHLHNIWLGVTVENQQRADERIPILLDTPAAVRFVSVEPCLSPVDLSGYMPEWDHRPEHEYWRAAFPDTDGKKILVQPGIDWTIVGAESGPSRRPFDVAWAVDLYEQCKDAGVPFFFKQGSDLRPGQHAELPGIGKVQEWPQ